MKEVGTPLSFWAEGEFFVLVCLLNLSILQRVHLMAVFRVVVAEEGEKPEVYII